MTQGAHVHDVAVIGAGVVGSAIARALAGHRLDVALLEARADVGDGTSKANTAILHTGYDAKPGTLEARLVARGYELLSDFATKTGIGLDRTGAILVAWTPDELAALPSLQDKAVANGYHHTELVGPEEIYDGIPALGPGALGGLSVPGESVICTWTTTLALATDAVRRGATLLLERPVTGVDVGEEHTVLQTPRGPVHTRWVVNAAGLGSDVIDQHFGYDRFHVTPRRGELLVFDKLARARVGKIVLPVPSKVGKGVLVSPTIYGNVMVGPTAEDLTDRSNTATSEDGFEFLRSKTAKLMPELLGEEITAAYAGLRAAADLPDYLIDVDAAQRYVGTGGIRSTGLTSAMAVAEHVEELLSEAGLTLEPRTDLPDPPRMAPLAESAIRPYLDEDLISRDPAYGQVVCFCERVTAGEIRDALGSDIPATTLGALRRRTRAMNGRCQGFFCGAEVQARLTAGSSAAAGSPSAGARTAGVTSEEVSA